MPVRGRRTGEDEQEGEGRTTTTALAIVLMGAQIHQTRLHRGREFRSGGWRPAPSLAVGRGATMHRHRHRHRHRYRHRHRLRLRLRITPGASRANLNETDGTPTEGWTGAQRMHAAGAGPGGGRDGAACSSLAVQAFLCNTYRTPLVCVVVTDGTCEKSWECCRDTLEFRPSTTTNHHTNTPKTPHAGHGWSQVWTDSY